MAPIFNKLTSEQVAEMRTKTPGRAPVDLTEYTEFLREVPERDFVEVTIGDSDNARTIKRRVTTAARSLGMTTKYRRAINPGTVVFQYLPISVNSQPSNGKVGRPRKVQHVVEPAKPAKRTRTRKVKAS